MKTTNKIIRQFALITMVMIFFSSLSFAQGTKKTDTVKIKTSAVCGSCKARIEKNVASIKGVVSVSLDIDTKICTIVYKSEKTNPDLLRKVISRTGYDADNILADPKAYNSLPNCCKKSGE